MAQITVVGMTCQGCVNALRNALLPLLGEVEIDLDSGTVVIPDDQAGNRDALRQAIEQAGFSLQEA